MTRQALQRTLLALLLALTAFGASSQGAAAPEPALAAVEGVWRGTLTYRDYSSPDKMVTLPTRLAVALSAPAALTLHYVYDDGPGKIVHAYEQLVFDFARDEARWTSGSTPATRSYRIVASREVAGGREWTLERPGDRAGSDRIVLTFAADRLQAEKTEIDASGSGTFRNRYVFRRD